MVQCKGKFAAMNGRELNATQTPISGVNTQVIWGCSTHQLCLVKKSCGQPQAGIKIRGDRWVLNFQILTLHILRGGQVALLMMQSVQLKTSATPSTTLLTVIWGAWNHAVDGTWTLFTLPTTAVFDLLGALLLPDFPTPDYEDRKVMSRDADAPRRVVYGRTRVGGVCRYIESSGDDSNTLHLIVIFAAHSCADIERVYFNGELAFIGTVAQGQVRAGKASMIYETGKQAGSECVNRCPDPGRLDKQPQADGADICLL